MKPHFFDPTSYPVPAWVVGEKSDSGNDACPSRTIGGFSLFVDATNPMDREMGPDSPRFAVLFEGDVVFWSEVDTTVRELWETIATAFASVSARGEGNAGGILRDTTAKGVVR